MLLTGLRIGEAISIRYDMIDGDTLTLPETKNGKSHRVYLSKQALGVLESRKDKSKSKFVFPMMTDLKRHMREDRVQNPLRAAIPALKMLPFTAHDLRRSFATGVARLKCPRPIISLALNHAIPDITSRYDLHSHEAELREWWATWGAHVESLNPTEKAKKQRAV